MSFDLVAVGKDGNVRLIDVKSVSYRKNIKPTWKKSKEIKTECPVQNKRK